MLNKRVIIGGKAGVVKKFLGSEHGTERYKVKMEDGTMIDASVIEMESLPEEHGAGEMGTTKLLKKYLKDTPYMTIDAKFTKEF